MNEIAKRIESLRKIMHKHGMNAFITPSTDPHSGEYVPLHWQSRAWISGFDGSAGIAVVSDSDAAVWTDSRYFLQAADQIAGSGMTLQKEKIEGTPTQSEWIGQRLKSGDCVGIDGWVNTVEYTENLASELAKYGISIKTDIDPYQEAWTDRPPLPSDKVVIQPLEYAGESTRSKIQRIREAYRKNGADALLVSMLDDVAWTLNLRGNDIEFTPVFVSYLVITNNEATLYVDSAKLTGEVKAYLQAEGVSIKEYTCLEADLRSFGGTMQIEPAKTNYAAFSFISNVLRADCPVSTMKIMKNEAEIQGYRSAMLKDGIAMVKWMRWAMEAVKDGKQTELSLDERLTALRAEQPLARGRSFASIMSYGAHAAVIHYHPTPETDIPVEPRGFLLIDSGGQYLDGTTDITRTLPVGPLTDDERLHYTLVLRGWINLARAHFPKGTYGTQLDCLARTPMWEYGINYLHGTGHGVGSYMSVHEGPHQFRMNYMPTPLMPGMTITDEPGIYIDGSHGVRHENTMLVVEDQEGITYGPYYKFEQLTICPVFTSPIMKELLQKEETEWFNNYQQMCYDKLAPHLDEETRQWLFDITRPI